MIISLKKETGQDTTKNVSGGNIWWEISAYAIRTIGIVTPSAIIATINHTWLKTGIGFSITLVLLSLFIIYQKPLKSMMSYAPGVVPFAIFLIVGYFFYTTANSLFIIGGSGLVGCIAAVPCHLKYTIAVVHKESPEVIALRELTERLDKLNKVS